MTGTIAKIEPVTRLAGKSRRKVTNSGGSQPVEEKVIGVKLFVIIEDHNFFKVINDNHN